MEKTLIPPRKPLRGPAGLDGIQIEGCTFTESVGKKEPRPPLYCAIIPPNSPLAGQMCGGVFLVVPGGKVLVRSSILPPGYEWSNPDEQIPGVFRPSPPKGPDYTGPITPAMWAIIRRHWNP